MKKRFISCFVLWLSAFATQAQTDLRNDVYQPADVRLWRQKTALLPELSKVSTGERIIRLGKTFLGTPYQAHTLEVTPEEKLVVNLRGVDCTTFVESTLALTLQRGDTSFAGYCRLLEHLRYRQDSVAGYPSRLHYLSDWLHENERKGILRNITAELGGQPLNKKLDFMTTHRTAYQQLQEASNYQAIQQVEASLAQRPLLYIPKEKIRNIEAQLQDGDILAITTSIGGLDASHVGFALRQNGRVYLLHASSDAKKVIVSSQPLAEYLLSHKSQTGIMVARAVAAQP